MGVAESKPFVELSSAEVAQGVASLGAKFKEYARLVEENGVDGSLLQSLAVEEFEETLEDLEITNRLHRRVLVKEFKKVTTEPAPPRQDATECPFNTSTPESDLEPYREITRRAHENGGKHTHAAGVKILCKDGLLSLSGKVRRNGPNSSEVVDYRDPKPSNKCICYKLLNDGNDKQDFYARPIPPKAVFPEENGVRHLAYTGYVIRDDAGKRIGIVCMVEYLQLSEIDLKPREAFLRDLAQHAAYQLQLRKALIARKSSLERQIEDLHSKREEIVLDATGPVKPVRRHQVRKRLSLTTMGHYPSPEDVATAYTRETRELHVFRQKEATGDELAHLPQGFFDSCAAMGLPEPPIHQRDMERCANSEALGIFKSIRPGCDLVTQLQQYVGMANRLFGFPHVAMSFQGPAHQYCVCSISTDPAIRQMNMAISDVVSYEEDRVTPFMVRQDRATCPCNYPMFTGKTFVVHDINEDKTFHALIPTPVRAIAGAPIKDAAGRVIALICMLDSRCRNDFTAAHEIQLEQLGHMALQSIENWLLRKDVERLEGLRGDISSNKDKSSPPEENATMVFTDIQGSTALWETNPRVMRAAQDLHDTIIRRVCSENEGYEVDTEGDSFQLVFHDPVDALSFALEAQAALFEAPWSPELLNMSNARDDGAAFRGLRVRMGVHQGDVETMRNELTGRIMYTGDTVGIAKSLERVAHGGQIITSSSTWNVAEFFAGTSLKQPQVVDLGTHVVKKGEATHEGIISQRLIQLVPSHLSFDYFAARSRKYDPELEVPSGKPHSLVSSAPHGRQFHPVKSLKCTSASFHEAPFVNNEVTIAFVNMEGIENFIKESSAPVIAAIVKLIGTCVDGCDYGYHCQNDMLAFHTPSQAILFGLQLMGQLKNRDFAGDGTDLSTLVKYGCVRDKFLTMGPHKTTGRADYFGKVVNRAARITNSGELGSVSYGVVTKEPLQCLDRRIRAEFVGMRALKGVQDEMAVYECALRADWRDRL